MKKQTLPKNIISMALCTTMLMTTAFGVAGCQNKNSNTTDKSTTQTDEASTDEKESDTTIEKSSEGNDHTANRVEQIKVLGQGINVGNDLDVNNADEYIDNPGIYDYESFWNNQPVTVEYFVGIKQLGFDSVRIPVTWSDHIKDDGSIREDWMTRVREVVDMALDNDLYVILDSHHEDYIVPKKSEEAAVKEKLSGIWKQIAEEFSAYDEKLMFEGLNEPRLVGDADEWTAGTDEAREVVAEYNKTFVETVRSVPGNENRELLVCGYVNSFEKDSLSAIYIPKEDEHIIVSVHAYIPYNFTANEGGVDSWDGDESQKEVIDSFAANLRELFIDNDIPVVVTEFGCKAKNDPAQRVAWTTYYTDAMEEINVPYFWWDDGGDYTIVNRADGTAIDADVVSALVD